MIYFDNAATTFPKPSEVYDFMDEFNRNSAFSINRGNYDDLSGTQNIVSQTRQMLLNLFNCNANYKVVFTPSATISINTVLQGLSYKNIKNVYITPFEHNAVLRPLYYLQKKYNFDIITLKMSSNDYEYDIDNIQAQFNTKKPDILVMSHASNAFGIICPIEKIISLAKRLGCTIILDCAQTAGLLDIDMCNGFIDYLIFAGHKTLYAPFGVSGIVMKDNSVLSPLYHGGTGVLSQEKTMPNFLPERLEAGSLNTLSVAGLYASLKWIEKITTKKIREKETKLKHKLLQCLGQFGNIKIIENNNGIGIISCIFEGYSPDEIGKILKGRKIAVRTGLHCSPLAHQSMGTFPLGTVRFSLSYFNSTQDIKELERILTYIYNNS